MTAYIIEIHSDMEKHEVIYGHFPIIGPFDDADQADTFAEAMGLGKAAERGMGGYSAYHVICDGTSRDPVDYLFENLEEIHEGPSFWSLDYLDVVETPKVDRLESFIQTCRTLFGDETADQVVQDFAERAQYEADREAEIQRRLDAGEGVPSSCRCVCGCGIYNHADLREQPKAIAKDRRGRIVRQHQRPMEPKDAGGCGIHDHKCEKFEGTLEIPINVMSQWAVERRSSLTDGDG